MSTRCACRLHRCSIAPREPRYVHCRPCAAGNHTGRHCLEYLPLRLAHLDRACAACGFDSALHPDHPR